jgi:cellulose synthase/poly-beta-1,6-N-acetylglucosamine synthase-like glycosyltransferase
LLVGGGVIGFMAAGRRLGRVVPLLTAGVALGCAVPVALATRRPPITPDGAAAALGRAPRRPTFTVLVGARDEAAVLTALVRDVAAQDYRDADGRPLFELVVVDDRSVDGGGAMVLAEAAATGIAAVTRVIRREGVGLADGKGAALTAAQPDVCAGDIVAVLDADARIGPDFLRRAGGYFAAGAEAVTARRRIMDADRDWLAGAQADEQTLDGELNRGRWAMGGCSEFRGNGIMVRRDLLARAGGWRAAALTEDIDLSSRIAAVAGVRVAWAIDVQVWEEPVRGLGGLWRQRLRWAEGALRRAIEHGPAVVASRELPLAARMDFVAYAGQLVVPAIGLGAAAAAFTGRPRTVLTLLAGYFGVSAGLGWDSLRWERTTDGGPLGVRERAGRTLRVAVFNFLWLLVVPRALLKLAAGDGGIRYEKMAHHGPAAADWDATT